MSILGLGFDATDIPRVREVFGRYGDRFLHRVFTDGEIAYCTRHRDPVPSLAARFAAKEATMKALGTGHSRGVLWKDIEGAGPGIEIQADRAEPRHKPERTSQHELRVEGLSHPVAHPGQGGDAVRRSPGERADAARTSPRPTPARIRPERNVARPPVLG